MTDQTDSLYLAGKLLIAMPTMGDPRFHRSVIFLCAHDEKGAMGLVINNILPDLKFKNLLSQVGITSDINIDLNKIRIPVMSGGPVESSRGFILHSNDFQQADTIQIDQDISVTGTIDALKQIAQGEGPEDLLFILGYAGWSPGQLDEELQRNAWLVVDADPSLVFKARAEEKWDKAAAKLGIDPGMLSTEAGRA